MTEDTVESLEAEYKTMLASKLSAMKKEEEDRLALVASQEAEDAKKAEEDKKLAAIQETMDAVAAKFNLQIVPEDPTAGEDNGTRDTPPEIPKELAFAQKFAANAGHKTLKAYENIAEDYVANGIIAFTDSDSSCEDIVTSWENVDYFADAIWLDVICKSDFLSKGITVKGLDFKAGYGGLVQIRVINHSTASKDFSTSDPCGCLSCVSNTFSTYTLTMETYGDYKVLCDENLFTAGDVVKTAVMKAMSSRAQERIDYKIMSVLEAATPTYSETLGASCGGSRGTYGACCTYTMDLYNKIIDLEADMRAAGFFYDTDPVLLLSPTVAAHLKYKDGLNMPSYIAANIAMDGLKLAGIGNIRVIETCHARKCTDADTTGAPHVQAVMIDPSRAIGEAWGKRPTFKVDDDPIECGSQKIVLRMWADFAILDPAATGHVLNP